MVEHKREQRRVQLLAELEIMDQAEAKTESENPLENDFKQRVAELGDTSWIDVADVGQQMLIARINMLVQEYDRDTKELKQRISKLEHEVEQEKGISNRYMKLLDLVKYTNSELEEHLCAAQARAETAEKEAASKANAILHDLKGYHDSFFEKRQDKFFKMNTLITRRKLFLIFAMFMEC
jgi:hypothetical protein